MMRASEEGSLEELAYREYVHEAIRRGREAAEHGELIDQDEVERRMSKWLGE